MLTLTGFLVLWPARASVRAGVFCLIVSSIHPAFLGLRAQASAGVLLVSTLWSCRSCPRRLVGMVQNSSRQQARSCASRQALRRTGGAPRETQSVYRITPRTSFRVAITQTPSRASLA